jgi:hypothetical protein
LFKVSKSGHNFNLEQSEELAGYILNNHILSDEMPDINHLILHNNQELQLGQSENFEIYTKNNEEIRENIDESYQIQIKNNDLEQEK